MIGSWEVSPGSTGSIEFDALLAAIAHREFEEASRVAPAWACIESLPQPWVPDHPFLTRDRVIAKTPDWLRRMNIFVPARDLVTG